MRLRRRRYPEVLDDQPLAFAGVHGHCLVETIENECQSFTAIAVNMDVVASFPPLANQGFKALGRHHPFPLMSIAVTWRFQTHGFSKECTIGI